MDLINCQGAKRTCNKSKLSNRKTPAKLNVLPKILFLSQAVMRFIDCQGAKRTCKKVNCPTEKTLQNKI
jgi:hypothetical protein